MSEQINLKFSDEVLVRAKKYSKDYGCGSVQEFIRELVREKLFEKEVVSGFQTYLASENFEKEVVSGFQTYLASEKVFAKLWCTKEEDEAWKNL